VGNGEGLIYVKVLECGH